MTSLFSSRHLQARLLSRHNENIRTIYRVMYHNNEEQQQWICYNEMVSNFETRGIHSMFKFTFIHTRQ